ncbi:MAG: NYN domain-containing protein [Sandaracinaceae bacterium]
MGEPADTPNLAIFCDYENVAIGARDAKFSTFDIELVLERLLDKGKIVVKKAYSDWDRYKNAKRGMHEAAFEMIEIPHVSYSGKNSADIRMVVDALDLCHTKGHIDTFVVISGDSDFSPLVSKLRENDKVVIGVGVKSSSSDLLIENCDDFIYYDDLVRAKSAERGRRKKKDDRPADKERAAPRNGGAAGRATVPTPVAKDDGDVAGRREEALDHVLDVVEALFEDRDGTLWGSMVKQTLKRKRPNFSERFHGYRSFSELLEDAQERGLLELSKDQKSGGYLITGFGPKA